jgi:hypothetical protein
MKKNSRAAKKKRNFAIFFFILLFVIALFGSYLLMINVHQKRLVIAQPPLLQNNQPTILAKYFILDTNPDYAHIKYRPRQFTVGTEVDFYEDYLTHVSFAGDYNGWDMMNAPRDNLEGIKLKLNRPAVIAVVWRDNTIPDWLQTWQKARSIGISGKMYTTFQKHFPAQEIILSGGNYDILLAEQNGNPSIAPAVPSGLSIPQPNQSCPKWVHDQYQARGPDGKLYPTWHPQIDPVYWCYFNHEHGSDPSLFDKEYRIPFGYAGSAMGMNEAHVGFKVFVWDDEYGYRWLALQHQGTATNQAACGRHHELDFVVKDKKTGEILAENYFVGDYGYSADLQTSKPLTPSACPDQGLVDKDNVGVRFLPIAGRNTSNNEPWVVNSKGVIGFKLADFAVSTLDSERFCKDNACDDIVYTGNHGVKHILQYTKDLGPEAGPGHSGIYYTDPLGKSLRRESDNDAVRQYIKPGNSVSSKLPYISTVESLCGDTTGAGELYECGKGIQVVSSERENAIAIPN